ncbi:acyl-CoA dehydrogenase family protein [Bradyrhizobium sediminis]|uniref:Acyl-CoA dehydrogenase family protein n=1 Tax=Bradyrhizobium sediminis TaxID=2840469 RepID=A0A975RKY2_9BRAD|nr:acyl-CoA dehydrogenase family protein [Bradyrhizobium sediminis]QWG11952.1 acyl-CoA dehydrogenase family protein [Bradyrhizobium sediminis]
MGGVAFDLPEDVVDVRDGVLRFVEAQVTPRIERSRALLEDQRRLYDESGRYSSDARKLIRDIRMLSAQAGFYAMCAPVEIGGGGLGHLAYYVAWEAIYRRLGGQGVVIPWVIAHWAFGPSRLLTQATEQARSRCLTGMISGETSMCFGLSEPGAGSDASMIKTRAVRTARGWKISGRKLWTTNAPTAEWCIVFAITDADKAARKAGGISAFLVPTDAPGFTVESVVRLFGHAGGHEGALVLEDVEVEPWQLVGELDQGFKIALYGVSLGRVYNSARAVGQGRWALEMALDYAKQREAFGAKISEYQGVSFPLAESATELHAAHLMGLNAATLLDRGDKALKELSMAKAYSVQAGFRAVDRAIQTHGGMGLTNEVGLVHAWQDLRIVNIADGTNEILTRMIAQRLMAGDLDL